MPIALTIAGSDSGGGAGIQADLKTFQAYGVFGTSVVTAVTAQNTRGVTDVHGIPASTVAAQIDALAQDLRPGAMKTGMLFDPEVIHAVAEGHTGLGAPPWVLDPVMVATSGHRLIGPEAEAVLAEVLLPRATLVTPNLPEAAALTGVEIDDEAGMRRAAEALLERGCRAVLLKGGHLSGARVVDLLVTPDGVRRWERDRLHTTRSHGTGCTLSAAITAGLALGMSLEHATERALDYLRRALESAPTLGSGHGPVNHLVRP